MVCEIVIQVNDLEQCRYFYREMLALGEPVIDSCETAVFQVSPETTLVLKKSCARYLEHTSSAVSWTLVTGDFDKLCAELEEHGHLSGEEFRHFGLRARYVLDPEENVLILARSNPGE